MNKKIGIFSANILTLTIIIFFSTLLLSLINRTQMIDMLSYATCILLSWSYIIVTIVSSYLCGKKHKVASEVGKSFGIIYSVFVSLTYFTQLTIINNGTLSSELMNLFDYTNTGNWMFSINLIGYGIMAVSTYFVGVSIQPKNKCDSVLKLILQIHGIFVVCIALPMTKLFVGDNDSQTIGTLALMAWCMMFIPIPLLFARRFKKEFK
ncbi:hypothetical protein PV797_09175 [Clostridiaceae bacterium M8S5]|nr:hypothetical protein PV797_09175 [Clostridiaceae bacterium M8S5]